MKRKSYKSTKLGLVVVVGALLAAVPFAVMAEENNISDRIQIEATANEETPEPEQTPEVEETPEVVEETPEIPKEPEVPEVAEDEQKPEVSEDTEPTNTPEEAANPNDTVSEGTETTEQVEDSGDVEEVTDESTESTNEIVEETEATKETETSDVKLSEAIIGTWDLDGYTGFEFGDDKKGKLLVGENEFAFKYTIKNDQLKLNFSSSKASDGTYTASVDNDTLHLEGGEGTIGASFDLTKAN